MKMNSEFLSLRVIKKIQWLAVSLLYLKSENNNFSSSCITTAVNETFHGKLKSHLVGDKTVLMYICSLEKFVLGVIGGASVVE